MMISYSSNNEDVMLVRALQGIANGTYIDVGAATPVNGSNTYALYARGWSGVACDPIFNFEPNWAQEWCAVRPRDAVVRDAIGAEMGETQYWLCNWRGLSTCDQTLIDKQVATNGAVKSNGGNKVSVVTLDRVIDRLMNGVCPHLICIDVEGFEGEVLKGLDFFRHRPWIIVAESYLAVEDLRPHYPAWEPILDRNHYHCLWDDRLNRFYVADERRGEIERHFVYPPNFSDGYTPHKQYELQRRVADYENNHAILSIS